MSVFKYPGHPQTPVIFFGILSWAIALVYISICKVVDSQFYVHPGPCLLESDSITTFPLRPLFLWRIDLKTNMSLQKFRYPRLKYHFFFKLFSLQNWDIILQLCRIKTNIHSWFFLPFCYQKGLLAVSLKYISDLTTFQYFHFYNFKPNYHCALSALHKQHPNWSP